jgi:hypothetical protein
MISYYLEVTPKNSFNQRAIRTVFWHMGKSAQDIYATALTILQVGRPTIQLPSNPDFNSLSPEEKDRIYQDLHNQIDSLNLWRIYFAHVALSCGHWTSSGIRSSQPRVCNCFCLQIPGHPIARLHQFSNDWQSTAKTSWLIPVDRFRRWFSSSWTTWSSIPNS